MLSVLQKKADVVVVENGYVVEWKDPDLESHQRTIGFEKTSSPGVKVFTTKKDLMKFLEGFL